MFLQSTLGFLIVNPSTAFMISDRIKANALIKCLLCMLAEAEGCMRSLIPLSHSGL